MANVQLSWTAPTSTTGVEGLVVLRKSDAGSTPVGTDFIAADQTRSSSTASDLQANVTQIGSDITDLTVVEASETGLGSGSYWYAVFPYNAAGYGPAEITDSVLTIS